MTDIIVFNDTRKTLGLRINVKGTTPTYAQLAPLETKTVKTRTGTVLVKLWRNNVLMIQDRG